MRPPLAVGVGEVFGAQLAGEKGLRAGAREQALPLHGCERFAVRRGGGQGEVLRDRLQKRRDARRAVDPLQGGDIGGQAAAGERGRRGEDGVGQKPAARERDVKGDVRFVQCIVKGGEQAAACRRVVLEIRKHAGRARALRLKYQIGGEPVGAAGGEIVRRVAQAEQAVRARGGQLQALQRARRRDAQTQMQHGQPQPGGARRVAAGAYQNEVFRIYHCDRLPLCVHSARRTRCAGLFGQIPLHYMWHFTK